MNLIQQCFRSRKYIINTVLIAYTVCILINNFFSRLYHHLQSCFIYTDHLPVMIDDKDTHWYGSKHDFDKVRICSFLTQQFYQQIFTSYIASEVSAFFNERNRISESLKNKRQ